MRVYLAKRLALVLADEVEALAPIPKRRRKARIMGAQWFEDDNERVSELCLSMHGRQDALLAKVVEEAFGVAITRQEMRSFIKLHVPAMAFCRQADVTITKSVGLLPHKVAIDAIVGAEPSIGYHVLRTRLQDLYGVVATLRVVRSF